MKLGRLLAATLMLVLGSLAVRADEEEKVPLDNLPRAVLAAVKAKFPDAELIGAEKEKEDGKVMYEVQFKLKGSKYEVMVTPEGKITVVEKEIAAKDLPRAIADAIESRYPKATVQKAEEISKEDKVTVYEVLLVTTDKKKVEAVFEPAGKFLKEEKKDEKEK